jgi:single-strand DNA-binding protein
MVADPELKNTNSGTQVSNFRVAWSEKFKERENKLFLECKAFSALAEFICKHFSRGNELVVEGKLNTEEWKSQDGQNRSKIVLMVSGAHFCGKKADGAAPTQDPSGGTVVENEELPF